MSDDSKQTGAKIGSTGGVHTTTYISNEHLKAADFFVEQAADIEDKYPDRDSIYSSDEIDNHAYRSYCTSAVINTMAFLEATFNEIYSKMKEMGEQSYPKIKEQRFWRVMNSPVTDELFGRKKSTVEKYNNMLSIAMNTEISTGKDPGQSVECLRELRNAFVHYVPENVKIVGKTQTGGEYGFETGMQGRFDLNPYTGDGNPFFPDQCQSRGCAEWGVKKSLAFTDKFFSRMDVDRPYEPMLNYMEIDPP